MSKNLLRAVLIGLGSLIVFWSPFLAKLDQFWNIKFDHQGMNVIVQNFDGLNFLVIAKSWYSPLVIDEINAHFLTGQSPIYFAAHFPLFPLLISFFDIFLSLPNSLIVVVLLSNILLAASLYLFFNLITKDDRLATLLTTIGLFFPARILGVRAVGSNEPIFIALILLSLFWAIKQRYWPSAVAGALAVVTRSPGILLFLSYGLTWLLSDENIALKTKRYAPYLIMPIALISVFAFYGWRYQDLFAYFNSGDNLHLFFPPFQIFSNMQSWIQDLWREDIIYLYVFYGAGLLMIDKKFISLRFFGFVYGLVLIFVAHRDLARYALPIAPIVLVGYTSLISKIPTRTWWIISIMILPIYLFNWQFVLQNVQAISDWRIFY